VVEDAAQTLAIEVHAWEVREPHDLASAVAAAQMWGAQALLQLTAPFFTKHRTALLELLMAHHLPASCEARMYVVEGCLMTYGASFDVMLRRAAYYVDRLFKGAKPTDLPVEQPREFELVMNRTTAQALGLTLSPLLLYQATEADLHFYGQIYHDWPPEKCQWLTQKSFASLEAGGRIIIHEKLLNDDKTGPFAIAAFSISMLLWTEGQQYSGGELSAMLTAAGFTDIEVKPTSGYWSIVTGYKP